MTKKESAIILKSYYDMFYAQSILDIDKSDSIREFSYILKSLGLEKEKYIVENTIISERDGIKATAKEMYSLIFESFAKFNIFIHYNLSEIDMYYSDLQYKMTEEDIKCHNARINYISQ